MNKSTLSLELVPMQEAAAAAPEMAAPALSIDIPPLERSTARTPAPAPAAK